MTDMLLEDRVLLREHAIELKTLYERIRPNSPRWQQIDQTYSSRSSQIVRALTLKAGVEAYTAGRDELEALAKADLADRDRQRAAPRLADQARSLEQHRQHKQAWRDRTTAQIVGNINQTIAELEKHRIDLTGRADSEADIRGFIADITKALKASASRLAEETRASVDRENDARATAAA